VARQVDEEWFTSVLPSGADIVSLPRHVRLVP
jgi:hypothetical protein